MATPAAAGSGNREKATGAIRIFLVALLADAYKKISAMRTYPADYYQY